MSEEKIYTNYKGQKLTRSEVLADGFEWWKKDRFKKGWKESDLTEEAFIDDWCVCNWDDRSLRRRKGENVN